MFGMSMTEVVIILVVALILIGPKELPSIARTLGKTLRDVRKASDDLRDTFEREVMQEPVRPKKPPAATVAAGSAAPELPEGAPESTAEVPPEPAAVATASEAPAAEASEPLAAAEPAVEPADKKEGA